MKRRAVYQVVTHNCDGSTNRYLPVFASREDARRAAAEHEDRDYPDVLPRWSVHIERLPVEGDWQGVLL